MTDQTKAIIRWLSDTVEIPVFQEPINSNQPQPYISLGSSVGDFSSAINQQITIWTRSDSSYEEAYRYTDLISERLGDSGDITKGNECILWIKKGSPFAQNKIDNEKTIRAVLINLEISMY